MFLIINKILINTWEVDYHYYSYVEPLKWKYDKTIKYNNVFKSFYTRTLNPLNIKKNLTLTTLDLPLKVSPIK